MKRILFWLFVSWIAYAVLTAPARAESFFHAEVGLGMAMSQDVGDGTWVQSGVTVNHEHLDTPAYLAGLTGDITSHLSWHADYVYFGEQSASCVCVPDAFYNSHTHVASEPGYIPFNGIGHVQGVTLTLEPYTTWRGYRLAIEGGAWLAWSTWHDTHIDPAQPGQTNLSHKTTMQVSWVAGASIGNGNFTLSYRYYRLPQLWNPTPGLVTGTHMLMAKWRF